MRFIDSAPQTEPIPSFYNDTTLILEKKNQSPIRLDENLGLILLSFQVESTDPQTTTSELQGVDGALDLGTTYGPRGMEAKFLIQANDKYEYALMETNINRLFDTKEPFSIIDEDQPRRRWKNVKRSGKMEFERKGEKTGEVTIPMIAFSPYAESIGSLLDPYTFDSELWGFGMNIPMEEFSYIHNTRTFSIWNLGDKLVNPRHDMLQIFYKGASSRLKIINTTTGDVWQYNGTSQPGDTITLDGVFSRKNGVSIFGNTNHKLIRLAPGKNNFTLSGAIDPFEISFDFRFLYL